MSASTITDSDKQDGESATDADGGAETEDVDPLGINKPVNELKI